MRNSGNSDEWWIADDRAIGQCCHRGLEVEHAIEWNRDHVRTEGREDLAQLAQSLGVGSAASPDVHGATDLEGIAAVERSRRIDSVRRAAEAFDDPLHLRDLGCAGIGPRSRDHREVAVHQDRVLDEHGIGAAVRRGDRKSVV